MVAITITDAAPRETAMGTPKNIRPKNIRIKTRLILIS
jgi:hypothetical protein